MELQNQMALITGAGSGIGRATAIRFAEEGASVVLAGRRADRLAAVVREIEAAGGSARHVVTDLSDLAAVHRLADDADDVDILVNNAGIFPFATTAAQTVEDFDAMFAANVRGPYFLTAALLPKMAARGTGSVIVVTSIADIEGMPNAGAYGGTKAALASFARSWSTEFAGSGVRVNAVAPGNVRTETVVEALGEDALEEWGRTGNPTGRLGDPREIAEAVLFLASPRASYVTGVELAVDGGYTSQG
jgi:NAD(P)-dependent dehydrogenase (short-subunit alcohol dehydrogenase family)